MNTRTRALRLSLAAAGLIAVGCPGSLVDPSRFELSLSRCEPKVETLFAKTCAVAGCHSTADSQGNLDLEAPGVASRLLGVLSINADCGGDVLVDPAHPEQSLLYEKLLSPPPCGSRMPFLGSPLGAMDIACVKLWIESLRTADGGAAEGGISDASVSSSPDSGSKAPEPTLDAAVPRDTGAPFSTQ